MDLEGLKAWLPGPHDRVRAADRRRRRGTVLRRSRSGREDAAALSGHDGRQLAAAARAARRAAAAPARAARPARVRSGRRRRGASTSLRLQEEAGCDLVTDGELRRDNFYSFVAAEARRRPADDARRDARRRRGQGRLRAAAADARRAGLLDQQPDLRRPSAPARAAGARRSAVPASGTPTARSKVTLPGPYLLTRAMFVPEVDARRLPRRRRTWPRTSCGCFARRSSRSAAEGADFIQLDEPVLTELAFAPGRTRTFMCAALAAREDPAEELEFAVIADQPRGRGDHRRAHRRARLPWQLEPGRDDAASRQLSAARAVPRAAAGVAARARIRDRARRRSRRASTSKELGLGVVNPRTDAVESSAEIRQAVERALRAVRARADLPQPRLRLRHLFEPADEHGGYRVGQATGDGHRRCGATRIGHPFARHSDRSTTSGSTRVARSAGR